MISHSALTMPGTFPPGFRYLYKEIPLIVEF